MEHKPARLNLRVMLTILACVPALWWGLLEGKVWAHEAPMGWSYPPSCCSNRDCRQASEGEVRETADGYRIVSTGEVVPYQNVRVKDSPDGLFHVCQQGGDFDNGRVICLFRPSRGF